MRLGREGFISHRGVSQKGCSRYMRQVAGEMRCGAPGIGPRSRRREATCSDPTVGMRCTPEPLVRFPAEVSDNDVSHRYFLDVVPDEVTSESAD